MVKLIFLLGIANKKMTIMYNCQYALVLHLMIHILKP